MADRFSPQTNLYSWILGASFQTSSCSWIFALESKVTRNTQWLVFLIILPWKAHCGLGSEVFITYGHEYGEFPQKPTPVLLNPGPQDLGKPLWFFSFILILLSVFQGKAWKRIDTCLLESESYHYSFKCISLSKSNCIQNSLFAPKILN